MENWISTTFKYLAPTKAGRLKAIRSQAIVHVMNRATGQATLFNAIRALRPMAKSGTGLATVISGARTGCSFCDRLAKTPANTFGRIGSRTCANIAAYDGYHGVVMFEDHNPLRFRRTYFKVDEVRDLMNVSNRWAEKCHAEDPTARFFFLMWNCLWKAGASMIHGHAQMTVGREFHYGKVERMRRDALCYKERTGFDYFEEFIAIHKALGLVTEWGQVTAVSHLTPAKEREVILVTNRSDNPDLPRAIWSVLKMYAAQGVKSYNVAMYMPPIGKSDPKWRDFPVLVHLVDRGDPAVRTNDIGAMEMYASAVVATDPFAVAELVHRLPGPDFR